VGAEIFIRDRYYPDGYKHEKNSLLKS